MKPAVLLLFMFFIEFNILSQPVFKNPGLPQSESYEINEHFDNKVGYITTKINIDLVEKNNSKYYTIHVNEGNLFTNNIEVNYSDLTTISEKRTNLMTNQLEQYFIKTDNNVQFYSSEKKVKKNFQTNETNIYSPLAFFISCRGFPFEIGKSVTFKSYMYEYGDVLTMKLTNTAKETVKVKAGTYECYVLELAVGGWQSFFAPDKYYLYFNVASPHNFIQYKEKLDGIWYADELTKYSKK
jgi:hypothetical protein